jgi:hypothetical protein
MYRAHKRSFKQFIQDIWLAIRGQTFASIKGCCHKCDSDFYIEVHQDLGFTHHTSGIGVGCGQINSANYFPSVRARSEFMSRGQTAVENLSYPPDMKRYPHISRRSWKAELKGSWLKEREEMEAKAKADGIARAERAQAKLDEALARVRNDRTAEWDSEQ